ncbi:MAG: D-glycerate dehydrogenase [Alphaproteobacteria bacterium]|jgi:lactate dehydrogenase-like 2-hydroxyacid dehydrogenase|nr:D-glycerate dehydrogenase [Alphaproteobacteria bacterium]MBT4082286.1 D-glycerate dehydrogenase [Alphaproteobacteria bacterium]MBT4542813.1 D-glycerate dehydrogenase [Alphaproteobacteria bacterium]MBT7744207.1 D-glycerate dehydrogenase [Alphaproteobacteria bacterium]
MSKQFKVLVSRRLPVDVAARVDQDYDAVLNQEDDRYSTEALLAAAEGKDALMVSSSDKLSADVLAKMPDTVRIIATVSVGYEHIDVDAATKNGIIITNTPDVLTEATSDTGMLLLLAAARRAHEGQALVRENKWQGFAMDYNLGVDLMNKRLGILGMGRIGRALAHRAAAFGMKIHYHNRSRVSADLEAYAGDAEYHEDADEMLPICDFLSIHSPLTPETAKFLNAERIAKMPDGAIVVNTSRGGVVDDEALIAALKSGKLRAAGLDVFEGEPNIHPEYRNLQNIFMLPHIGSGTVETRNAMGFCAVDNLDAVLAGKAAITPLN